MKIDEVAERHHGRKQLIERLVNSSSTSTTTATAAGSKRRRREVRTGKGGLAMGYEVMEIRDDADEGELLAWLPSSQVWTVCSAG